MPAVPSSATLTPTVTRRDGIGCSVLLLTVPENVRHSRPGRGTGAWSQAQAFRRPRRVHSVDGRVRRSREGGTGRRRSTSVGAWCDGRTSLPRADRGCCAAYGAPHADPKSVRWRRKTTSMCETSSSPTTEPSPNWWASVRMIARLPPAPQQPSARLGSHHVGERRHGDLRVPDPRSAGGRSGRLPEVTARSAVQFGGPSSPPPAPGPCPGRSHRRVWFRLPSGGGRFGGVGGPVSPAGRGPFRPSTARASPARPAYGGVRRRGRVPWPGEHDPAGSRPPGSGRGRGRSGRG